MQKRPGDRRVSERRKQPSRPISKILDPQTRRFERELYHRQYTGQVTTDTRKGSERRIGPEERRIGPINRRSGADRRKQPSKSFGPGLIPMTQEEYDRLPEPKPVYVEGKAAGKLLVRDKRIAERRQSKGRRVTDK